MDTGSFLLERVLPAAASGLLSAAAAAWAFLSKLKGRVDQLEKDLAKFKEDKDREHIEITEKALRACNDVQGRLNQHIELNKRDQKEIADGTRAAYASLKRAFDELKPKLDEDIDEVYKVLKTRSREQAELRRLMNKLNERYLTMEGKLETVEKQHSVTNDEMTNFIREQQEQWQSISRALGQIEGYLRATTRKLSGSFPETKPRR